MSLKSLSVKRSLTRCAQPSLFSEKAEGSLLTVLSFDQTDLFLDVANKIKVVRRPQIRTGAAKKLTPLLKDVAEKRRNKGTPPANGTASPRPGVGGGKLSRANSDAGSDAGLLSPNLNTSRDYGTISSTASNGASTPRRRPSAPHRLGSITSTGVAFDKVKVKGGNSLLRQQTLEAVRQNLEAIGNGVDDIREIVPENEGGNLPTSSSNAKLSTNGTEDGSEDSAVTVTATAKVKPEDLEAGDDKEDEEGEERLADAKSIMDAKEQDENAPLLGGKQVAGSPGNY